MSKYDDIFGGMSEDEINEIVDDMPDDEFCDIFDEKLEEMFGGGISDTDK